MLYFDITELYVLAHSKLKYYGIARVVAELAYEVHLLRPDTKFVVYDETRGIFLLARPRFGRASPNGLVDPNVPASAMPRLLKGRKAGRNLVGSTYAKVFDIFRRAANRRLCRELDLHMPPHVPNGGVLFSAARPRLIAQYIESLRNTVSPTQLVPLLHDVIPLHEQIPASKRHALTFLADNNEILRQTRLILGNSQFTAKDIAEKSRAGVLAPLPEMAVVPLAHECRDDGEQPTIVLPDRPYIMGVGITLGRKNLDLVFEAQRLLLAKGQRPPLMVIAGVNKPRTMARLARGPYRGLAEHFQPVNSPTQANLIALYRNALATVTPSRLEGWGLPVGESLWLGTPAIAAKASSLPEVGGDLACYIDPDSPQDLAELLERLLTNEIYRETLVAKIRARHSTLRSWRDVAVDLLAALPLEMPESAAHSA